MDVNKGSLLLIVMGGERYILITSVSYSLEIK